jgi:hypothetical protein
MIDEYDLSEILHRRAAAIPSDPTDLHTPVVRARRRQFLTGSVSVVLVGVLALGAIVGLKALRSWERTPFREPTPSPIATERVGFLGLAPEGAQASLPPVGELVIRFDNFCCPGQALFVFSDGRMIWSQNNVVDPGQRDWVDLAPQGADEYETGYLEQRLTPAGVELLRSELISTGLFEKSVTFEAKQYGLGIGVRNGGRMITLEAFSDGDPIGATAVQARAIEKVTAILEDLEAWLPNDAWADRTIRAFVPTRYLVVMHFYSSGGQTPDDPSELPSPADQLLRQADEVGRASSCQVVTTAEARRIHAELMTSFGELTIPYGGVFGTPVTIKSALPHWTECSQGGW